ncbi:hypothetical protein COY87_02495 [Candidatus Roizmanbacteria bacterium CG_4_10_14_0_8_um_filter_33_9]|uniref:Uncharacterized protein n=1 Tax=Candidatus Roizmanbacteria bacterium CG_4_10_14_0_8_um_filter_33_9 TaxID=1974826 RepID=A0A2M7QIL8_9BACT|nr:MAG: hypothetical protein COY87_02495 [Candidatus Roizmanbacteria bacterium CG_4_10_14_0_8_um_filter_33_9]
MITDQDITKLKQVFATKDDLNAIQTIVKKEVEEQIINSIKPINQKLNKMQQNLNLVIRTFDKDIIETKHRVDRIEKHLDLPPIQSN